MLHISPARGWLNDPNGLVHWKGRHHVFYQSDPASLWFGRMQWGHVSSEDLISWEHHPAALVPGVGADRDGCWSGCIVDDGGTATAVYSGIVKHDDGTKTQSVLLATSSDPLLIEWEQDSRTPAEVELPPFEIDAFRDPHVWRQGEHWSMLLGTDLPDGNGGLLLYRSGDLRRWGYVGIFLSGADLPATAPWAGSVWECPSLATNPTGEALLTFSVHDPLTLSLHYTISAVGRIEADRFIAETARRLDNGHDCYAAVLEQTEDHRLLAYGWGWEALSADEIAAQGLSGVMTVPREIDIVDGGFTVRPARELTGHGAVVHQENMRVVTPDDELAVEAPPGTVVQAVLRLDHASSVQLAVRRSPSTGEQLIFDYSGSSGSIVVDRSRASTMVGARGGRSTANYRLPSNGLVELTVIIDNTVVEIFVGSTIVFTERIYPQASDATTLSVSAQSATFGERPPTVVVEQLTVRALTARSVPMPAVMAS